MTPLLEILFGTDPIAWVQRFVGYGHPLPFRVMSLLGDTWGMMLVIGVALWLFGREAMYAVGAIVVAGAGTKVLLGLVFDQTRPAGPGIVVYEHLEWSSFPSGHVYETVAPWGLLWMLGCVPLWLPVVMTVLVGLGRLYLGVHYLGDVLGGVLFAVPLVWAFGKVWPWLRGWVGSRSSRELRVAAMVVVAGALGYSFIAPHTARRFEVIGMAIGGALSLLLHSSHPVDGTGPRVPRARLRALLLGVAGLVALVLVVRTGSGIPPWASAAAAAVGIAWVIVVVPRITGRWADAGP